MGGLTMRDRFVKTNGEPLNTAKNQVTRSILRPGTRGSSADHPVRKVADLKGYLRDESWERPLGNKLRGIRVIRVPRPCLLPQIRRQVRIGPRTSNFSEHLPEDFIARGWLHQELPRHLFELTAGAMDPCTAELVWLVAELCDVLRRRACMAPASASPKSECALGVLLGVISSNCATRKNPSEVAASFSWMHARDELDGRSDAFEPRREIPLPKLALPRRELALPPSRLPRRLLPLPPWNSPLSALPVPLPYVSLTALCMSEFSSASSSKTPPSSSFWLLT